MSIRLNKITHHRQSPKSRDNIIRRHSCICSSIIHRHSCICSSIIKARSARGRYATPPSRPGFALLAGSAALTGSLALNSKAQLRANRSLKFEDRVGRLLGLRPAGSASQSPAPSASPSGKVLAVVATLLSAFALRLGLALRCGLGDARRADARFCPPPRSFSAVLSLLAFARGFGRSPPLRYASLWLLALVVPTVALETPKLAASRVCSLRSPSPPCSSPLARLRGRSLPFASLPARLGRYAFRPRRLARRSLQIRRSNLIRRSILQTTVALSGLARTAGLCSR